MTCRIDLTDLISSAAAAAGVPPAIALSVAWQETRICHWDQAGNVVKGAAGEVGVFQLMPATARGLGVDPFDLNQNIQGGIAYLAQLYQQTGDWSLAVQRYNGSGPAARAYSAQVMARAAAIAQSQAPDASSPDSTIVTPAGDVISQAAAPASPVDPTAGGIPIPAVIAIVIVAGILAIDRIF